MKTALIGYTGFVGSELAQSGCYTHLFNSSNINEIRGEYFDEIVCCGIPAVKWFANKYPFQDIQGISRLVECLTDVKTKHFTLISTVDVYGDPRRVDEGTMPAERGLHFYGLHRLMVEKFVRKTFSHSLVVRLPGLFGVGLKKNVIFDMMNQHNVGSIDPRSVLQWYPVSRLCDDLCKIQHSGLSLFNVCPQPIRTGDIADNFFQDLDLHKQNTPSVFYDMQTQYPEILGGEGRYHFSREQVFSDLDLFLNSSRANKCA